MAEFYFLLLDVLLPDRSPSEARVLIVKQRISGRAFIRSALWWFLVGFFFPPLSHDVDTSAQWLLSLSFTWKIQPERIRPKAN